MSRFQAQPQLPILLPVFLTQADQLTGHSALKRSGPTPVCLPSAVLGAYGCHDLNPGTKGKDSISAGLLALHFGRPSACAPRSRTIHQRGGHFLLVPALRSNVRELSLPGERRTPPIPY